MNPRRLRLGFIFAATGMLGSLVLPLSGEVVVSLAARPILLALTLSAALLFAAAAWTVGSRAIAPGFAGVLCGAATTVALLRDPGINGSAAAGFWAIVLAVWLAAALCVMQLATTRPRARSARRSLDLAIPCCSGRWCFIFGKYWCAASACHRWSCRRRVRRP